MNRPDIQTYQSQVKAAHKYEVVDARGRLSLAGKKVHFIGAGGIGMSGLAQLLIKNKAIVTGSDQNASPVTDKLCQVGADIKIGHSRDNIDAETELVVVSAAVKEGNPELQLARRKGVKIHKYARMLGELMNCYDGIAVAGTHGKSTTSGWLSYLLRQAGDDANFIVGAEVTQIGSSSGTGDSRYFVAEACEYDRSFLNLSPKIACILNIEPDHLDYYKDEDEIVAAFGQFALRVKSGGVLIANGTDENVAKIVKQFGADLRCESFGFDKSCDFYAQNIQLVDGLYAFDVCHKGKMLGATRISLPGRHNILNGLAVVAMAVNAGLPSKKVLQLLPTFTGIDRRMMLKGRFVVCDTACLARYEKSIRDMQFAIRETTITILDDYAHHPTEIRASLEAIRQRYRPKRIWCVFQPHQYSRTRFLLDDFAESFKLADVIIVPEIYFVRDSQSAREEINSQILVDRIRANRTDALFIDSFTEICSYLKEYVTAGDLVVTMGAGDIWKVADEYIQRLGKDS